ncbi:MAG: hypothetical protein ACK5QT_07245 [Oligoflexia bacterium]
MAERARKKVKAIEEDAVLQVKEAKVQVNKTKKSLTNTKQYHKGLNVQLVEARAKEEEAEEEVRELRVLLKAAREQRMEMEVLYMREQTRSLFHAARYVLNSQCTSENSRLCALQFIRTGVTLMSSNSRVGCARDRVLAPNASPNRG